MASLTAGQTAEIRAADYLESLGYDIITRNWRTSVCEIDIVAHRQKRAYLIEVKYRRTAFQGSGFEYITPSKLKRLQFAAEIWRQNNDWTGDYSIGAIEVSGPLFQITNFLADIE